MGTTVLKVDQWRLRIDAQQYHCQLAPDLRDRFTEWMKAEPWYSDYIVSLYLHAATVRLIQYDPACLNDGPVHTVVAPIVHQPPGELIHDINKALIPSMIGIAKEVTTGVPVNVNPAVWTPAYAGKPAQPYAAKIASPLDDLAELFPALAQFVEPCPACTHANALAYTVIHLNDVHRWPREDIADWLETLDLDLTIQPASQGD